MPLDTSLQMETLFHQLLSDKSGEERLLMGFSMFDFSRQLLEASLTHQFPSMTEAQKRLKILESYYSGEISKKLRTVFS